MSHRLRLLDKLYATIAETYRSGTLTVGFRDAAYRARFHTTEDAIARLTDASPEANCIKAMSSHLAVWNELQTQCALVAVIQHTNEQRWPEDHITDGSPCWCQKAQNGPVGDDLDPKAAPLFTGP